MYGINEFVSVLDKIIWEKIKLRRKIFNEFENIPEEVLEKVVDEIDISKEYTIRYIDDPKDFEYYIKEKELLDYTPVILENNIGNARVIQEEAIVIMGKNLLFGSYVRHMDRQIENKKGKFDIANNYIIKKNINIKEYTIIDMKIKNNSVREKYKTEYCIYVPDILKICS